MTTSSNEPGEHESSGEPGEQESSEPGVIDDDQLPEDLQPTDDNPLAKDPQPDGGEGQNVERDGS